MIKLKVLIVDDHKNVRKALKEKLLCEPDLAVFDIPASSPEALVEAMKNSPQIVLLDCKTYIGDGIQLYKKIYNTYTNVSIIIHTSCLSKQEIDELNDIGITFLLYKDLEIDKLLGVIRSER